VTGKVAFGYLHPGEMASCFVDSMVDMLFFDAQTHGRFLHSHGKMGKRAGSAGVVDGRNQLARVMLDESEADWLLMIDSDMGFGHDTCERLIESAHAHDRPIMGGLCFAFAQDGAASFYGARWRPAPTLYDWHDGGDDVGFVPRFDYMDGGRVQEVAGTGAACILIHRLALEAIRDRYGPDQWFEPVVHPGSGRKFSEDLSFCVRAAGCDLPLHVDTSVKTTHNKGAVFYDEEFYFADRAGRRQGCDLLRSTSA